MNNLVETGVLVDLLNAENTNFLMWVDISLESTSKPTMDDKDDSIITGMTGSQGNENDLFNDTNSQQTTISDSQFNDEDMYHLIKESFGQTEKH